MRSFCRDYSFDITGASDECMHSVECKKALDDAACFYFNSAFNCLVLLFSIFIFSFSSIWNYAVYKKNSENERRKEDL